MIEPTSAQIPAITPQSLTAEWIVPRWSGRATSDWYPGFIAQFPTASALDVPNPDLPEPQTWIPAVQTALRSLSSPQTSLVLGHSVGVWALLHAIAAHQQPIGAVVLVAAWHSIDEPWPSVLPWQEQAPDWQLLRKFIGHSLVLISDNDPFTSNWQENAQFWREHLAADVLLWPDGKHFNAPDSLGAVMAAVERVNQGFSQ
jgi:uncharacterized protein